MRSIEQEQSLLFGCIALWMPGQKVLIYNAPGHTLRVPALEKSATYFCAYHAQTWVFVTVVGINGDRHFQHTSEIELPMLSLQIPCFEF